MKRFYLASTFSLFAALFAMLAGCASGTNSTHSAQAQDDTLYVVAPFSGNLSNFGAQIRVGVDAAIAEDKSLHRSSERVHAEYLDDGCDAAKAVEIAKHLVAVGARAVLGHVCSVASMPASDIYARAGIPMLSAASSNSAFTERGLSTVFRVAGRDDDQAPLAAATIATRFPGWRVAIVQEDDITGTGHGGRVRSALLNKGIVANPVITISSPDQIHDVVEKLIESQSQVVFYGGHQASQFGQLLSAARAAGFNGQFVSNDGAANKLVWTTAGAAADGLLFTFDRDYSTTPGASKAVARIKAMGGEPVGFTLNAYASAQILLQTLKNNSSSSESGLSDYLHETAFETAIGTLRFNKKGDLAESREGLFEWRDGNAIAD